MRKVSIDEFQGLHGCVIVKDLCGKYIGEVVGYGDGIKPKVSRMMGFKDDSTSHFKQCSVFSFCHVIL